MPNWLYYRKLKDNSLIICQLEKHSNPNNNLISKAVILCCATNPDNDNSSSLFPNTWSGTTAGFTNREQGKNHSTRLPLKSALPFERGQ